MPTAITHYLLAEEVYCALPTEIREKIVDISYYYLGAQGPDFLFFARPFGKDNLGKRLHRKDVSEFFRTLSAESRKDGRVFSYACGYLTHYATDVCFHPAIYERMQGREHSYFHHAVEHAYDGVFLKKYKPYESLFFYRLKKPNVQAEALYSVYKAYAVRVGATVPTEGEFVRAVGRYFRLCNIRLPLYRRRYAGNAEAFFQRAKAESLRLIGKFRFGKIDRASFGRHLLSGEEGEDFPLPVQSEKKSKKRKKSKKQEKIS